MTGVTASSIFLGILFGILFAAINVYLGLYIGFSLSASVPSAVVSLLLLRGLLRRATIHESNIVQTIASAGSAIAAAAVSTIPVLLITGIWEDIHYGATTLICLAGGLLGISFAVPLRSMFVVGKHRLPYPEAAACAEILQSGETRVSLALVGSIMLGACVKFLTSAYHGLLASVERVWAVGGTAVYCGVGISPALIGIGHLAGARLTAVIAAGGLITWMVALPIYGLSHTIQGNAVEAAWGWWNTDLRYLGIGAVTASGVWSIFDFRSTIFDAVRNLKRSNNEGSERRGEAYVIPLLLLSGIITLLVGRISNGSIAIALSSLGIIFFLACVFCIVATGFAGLVGTTISPLSAIIVCILLGAGAALRVQGLSGGRGLIAALLVAAVTACAASLAGDTAQSLSTGERVGTEPRAQLFAKILGVTVTSLVIAPFLIALNHTYGIGTGQALALKAPQAALLSSVGRELFFGTALPWLTLLTGALIAVGVI